MNKGFGFLFEMGCGKTLTAIAVAGAGYQQKRISRVLIVAPTSVVAVWPKEFQDYAAFPYTIRTLLGTKQQRLKALADLERFPYPHLKVAVINYESTWREEIFDALLDFDADLVIADESQRIKSHDAAQSKAMHQLGDKARYKLILSGTPVQNEAVDLWSQYRFLDPTIFGTNFYAFRSRYCEMGGFNRKQIVRYRDLDTLIRKEHSIAYRVTKEEALDLPEQTFENRYITLSRSERNLYDRLRRDSYAELADGGTITATTVLTKLLRLQQFTGGFLVEDDAIQPKLVSRGKLDALEDIMALWPCVVSGSIKFWYSAVMAALTAYLDANNDDVPNLSPSNELVGITGTVLADAVYTENADGTGGTWSKEVLLDQLQANVVNSFGVSTALNNNGWRTWGNRTAAYPANTDPKDMWFCCRRFFSWWGNSFILTYAQKVDDPANRRLIESIVDAENIRGNAYVAQDKCAAARIEFIAEENSVTDLINGKLTFHQHLAPYVPAEDILNTLEFDPDALQSALTGG